MYLIDTNVFLEILLNQNKKRECKEFLHKHTDSIVISDFSLHSIGVILLRNDKAATFRKFADDIVSQIEIVSLPKEQYSEITKLNKATKLDFDDSYQCLVAHELDLSIVTMDKDFKKAPQSVTVLFL